MKIEASLGHTIWCPFARSAVQVRKLAEDACDANRYISKSNEDVVAVNRFPAGDVMQGSCCLTQRCAAWRWVSKTHGVCGLAGPMFVPD